MSTMSYYDLNNIEKFSELLNCKNKEEENEILKVLNLKMSTINYKNGQTYKLAKYQKEYLCEDKINTFGLLRSVIFKNGKIMCFAPPKSHVSKNLVINNDNNNNDYFMEHFIEGTMINVFYDSDSSTWEIATRSNIGGDISFYMEKGWNKEFTFRSMFEETCRNINLDINNLNKEYVYSFVMQHKKNRIVKPIKENRLYLAEIYKIDGLKIYTIGINDINGENNLYGFANSKIQIIKRIRIVDDRHLNTLKQTNASMNTPYYIMGMVIKDSFGKRYKFRNPNYETVKKLRGNNPKLQFQYLKLRQAGMVGEYLKFYKEHRELFNEFRGLIHNYTQTLYENYIKCYIKKEKELREFPEKFKTHMYCIHHNLYLPNLMPEKKIVNKQVVIDYFNNLEASKQMFILNYDLRKNTDQNKREEEIKVESS